MCLGRAPAYADIILCNIFGRRRNFFRIPINHRTLSKNSHNKFSNEKIQVRNAIDATNIQEHTCTHARPNEDKESTKKSISSLGINIYVLKKIMSKNEISLYFSEFEGYLQLEATIRTRMSKQGKGRIFDKMVFLTRLSVYCGLCLTRFSFAKLFNQNH